MRIETLVPASRDAVRRLILDGLAERWGELDPSLNDDLGDLGNDDGRSETVLVFDGVGEVVGTGTIVQRSDATAEIVRMSVSPTARRGGVGRRIVEDLVDRAAARGVERVVLETTSTWTDAIAFYRSCGFEITHTTVGPSGEDTWFERWLTA